MIDLEKIEYFNYMKEQEELEDKAFEKIMDIYLIEESKKIMADIEKRKQSGEEEELTIEEVRNRINKLYDRINKK